MFGYGTYWTKRTIMAENAHLWPNLALLGPQILFFGEGAPFLYPHVRKPIIHLFVLKTFIGRALRGRQGKIWRKLGCLVQKVKCLFWTPGLKLFRRTNPKIFPFPRYGSFSSALPRFLPFFRGKNGQKSHKNGKNLIFWVVNGVVVSLCVRPFYPMAPSQYVFLFPSYSHLSVGDRFSEEASPCPTMRLCLSLRALMRLVNLMMRWCTNNDKYKVCQKVYKWTGKVWKWTKKGYIWTINNKGQEIEFHKFHIRALTAPPHPHRPSLGTQFSVLAKIRWPILQRSIWRAPVSKGMFAASFHRQCLSFFWPFLAGIGMVSSKHGHSFSIGRVSLCF